MHWLLLVWGQLSGGLMLLLLMWLLMLLLWLLLSWHHHLTLQRGGLAQLLILGIGAGGLINASCSELLFQLITYLVLAGIGEQIKGGTLLQGHSLLKCLHQI